MRLLRAADLAAACPMGEAIEAVAAGFVALSNGRATVPLRSSVPLEADLEFVGLRDQATALAKNLSYGDQRRLEALGGRARSCAEGSTRHRGISRPGTDSMSEIA